jgi:hypothetical protein
MHGLEAPRPVADDRAREPPMCWGDRPRAWFSSGDHEVALGQVERFEQRERPPLGYRAGQDGRPNIAA